MLCNGRNITADGFAQIMDHAELENLGKVQGREFMLEHHGHQAQAPGVLRGAFGAAVGGVTTAQRVFEGFGRTQKIQTAM